MQLDCGYKYNGTEINIWRVTYSPSSPENSAGMGRRTKTAIPTSFTSTTPRCLKPLEEQSRRHISHVGKIKWF